MGKKCPRCNSKDTRSMSNYLDMETHTYKREKIHECYNCGNWFK